MILSARETAELLLLVGRFVQAGGYEGELSPAQWMALRFFARANSFSRTPSAFAEFQATTRGTASQAIKALEAGGYLVRQRSEMHHTVHKVLTTVTANGAHRRFGVCQDCTYLGGETCSSSTSTNGPGLECLLFGVPIEPADSGLLCVHFQPTNEHRDSGHRE